MNTKTNRINRSLVIFAFIMLIIVIVCRLISNIPGIYGTEWDVILTKIRSFIYMGLYIGWTISVSGRIIHKQTQNLLVWIGFMAFFWIAIRTVKWFYVSDPAAVRHLWYLYYLPMNMIPTLGVYVAASVGKPESWKFPKWAWIFVGIAVLLTIGVLLNDSHQLAFRFLTPVWNEDDIAYGPVYRANIIWEIICGLTTVAMLLIKCRLPHKQRFLLIPFIPAMCSVIYVFVYILRVPVIMLIAGDITAFQCLFFVTTVECCIQCGLIRSNTGYDELFRHSGLRALIADEDYHIVLSSHDSITPTAEQMRQTKNQSVPLGNGLRLSAAPIRGGHVLWAEDVSELTEVLSDLEDVEIYLEGKRKVLEKEYETSREQQRAVEKNRLYNRIMTETNAQIELYGMLVEQLKQTTEQEEMRRLVSRIAVVCTYIKRRDNMIFLDETSEQNAGAEMNYCLQETMSALRLCGVNCQSTVNIVGAVSIEKIAELYEALYQIIMSCLDGLSDMYVFVNEEDGSPVLTLQLICDCDLDELNLPNTEIEKDGNSYTVTVTAGKGGDAK